jgi:hypothetical protein
VIVLRRMSVAVLVALAACTSRDGKTDEAAIADSTAGAPVNPTPAESASVAKPPPSGVNVAPSPLDVNPSVPRRPPGGGMMPGAAPDTVRGVIVIVGAEPMVRVTVRGDPRAAVTLVGAPALATLAGLEVWASGRRRGAVLDVQDFVVRAADGHAAIDGVLADRDGKHSVVGGDGQVTPIPRAPAAMQPLIGKRIWVTLVNGEVRSFGLIAAPR